MIERYCGPTSAPWRSLVVGSWIVKNTSSRSRERDDRGVVGDLHDLGVAGAPAADLLVGRVRDLAAGVARDHALDALQVLVDRLQAPEAAAAQRRRLVFHARRHRASPCRGPRPAARPVPPRRPSKLWCRPERAQGGIGSHHGRDRRDLAAGRPQRSAAAVLPRGRGRHRRGLRRARLPPADRGVSGSVSRRRPRARRDDRGGAAVVAAARWRRRWAAC